ncbi:MAG: xanthine dehydrogenase family protein molybdopterin-binding subunit [Bacillota bacterium]
MRGQFNYVGKSYPIHDALAKVTGELVYAGDIKFPHMLYAKLLLSPIAHGMIKDIDTRKAEELPGVVKVFTYKNSPSTPYNRYRLLPEQENCPEDQVLFSQKVRYYGDWVAVVVAQSEDIAHEAIGLIDVTYEEFPAVTDLSDALTTEIKIHETGNLIHEYGYNIGNEGKDADECIENEISVESIVRTPRVHHATMETHVCVARHDISGGITIWSSCQGAFGVRTVVADFLGLNYNKVRVIKTPVGGSFGGKQEAILEPLAAFLAKETHSTVMLRLNRKECIISTMTRPMVETRLKTKCSPDGKLYRCEIDAVLDAGGYATNAMDYIGGLMGKITKLYRIPQIKYRAKSVYTNCPVSGAMRGWGSPEFITAVEVHMDQIAKRLKLDPVTFRLKNLVHPFDIDAVTQISLGNAGIIDCLEKGAAKFAWAERYHAPKEAGRYRTGVGFACGSHKTSMFGGGPEFSTMTLKMNEDGTFVLNTAVQDLGCGSVQSIRVIAAESLSVDPEQILVLEADTERSPYDFGSYGSRVTYVCGACTLKVANKIKDQILYVAALALQQPKEYLKVKNGEVYYVKDKNQKISFKEIGLISKSKYHVDIIATETHNGVSNPGAYGAHFAEVKVDTETGLVKVTDYLAVHDVGRVINRSMCEGQLQGAVQMGIGYALCEEVNVNPQGRVINDSFKNYHVINAPDMPKVQVLLLERGGDDGPFGAKSIGEVAVVPVAAAVVNAVNNALGTNLSILPLTPKKIMTALKQVNI